VTLGRCDARAIPVISLYKDKTGYDEVRGEGEEEQREGEVDCERSRQRLEERRGEDRKGQDRTGQDRTGEQRRGEQRDAR